MQNKKFYLVLTILVLFFVFILWYLVKGNELIALDYSSADAAMGVHINSIIPNRLIMGQPAVIMGAFTGGIMPCPVSPTGSCSVTYKLVFLKVNSNYQFSINRPPPPDF